MHQLITKKGKAYWLSKEEVEGIRAMLAKSVPFITMTRYDKTINSFDIQEIGVPDFVAYALRKYPEIRFDGDIPVVQTEAYEVRYEDDKWTRYEKRKNKDYKTFEEYITGLKRLN